MNLSALKGDVTFWGLLAEQGFQPISAELNLDGKPVRKFRKEIIRVGEFHKSSDNLTFEITDLLLSHWVDTFKAMKKSGTKIPLPPGHDKFGDAEANRGYVDDLFVDNGCLVMNCSIVGEDASELAAKCDVSVHSPPQWKDGNGRIWKRPILHVALCTDPVIPGLSDFVPIAASQGPSNKEIPMLDLLKKLAGKVGVTTVPTESNQKAVGEEILTKLSDLTASSEAAIKKVTDAEAKTTAAETKVKILEASTKAKEFDPLIIKLSAENREGKLNALVASARITPAVSDKLKAVYCGTVEDRSVLVLSLQSDADGSQFDQLCVALAENDPLKLKEQSAAQTISLSNQEVKDKPNPMVVNAEKRAKVAKERDLNLAHSRR